MLWTKCIARSSASFWACSRPTILPRWSACLDTTTPSGKLTFHVFGALAEFEWQLIQERTQAGLRVARARGRLGGRPTALPADKQQLAVQLYQEKKIAVKQICALMGISKPTLYAYVRQAQKLDEPVDTKRTKISAD